MKANQKFLNGGDEAVSPVIAVILMVAITVVLAATVYVWVSGFGTQSGSPAKSISLTSAGALVSGSPTGNKTYTVASGTSGMRWQDITLSDNGVTQTLYVPGSTTACPSVTPASLGPNKFIACDAGNEVSAASNVINAGDLILVQANSGDSLRVLDSQANAVMLTLTVG
jgi:flagellin-like protein